MGGHIEREERDKPNPLQTTILREIQEETGLSSMTSIEIIGYINDNSDDVNKVHFGIVYIIYTNDNDVNIMDEENIQIHFKSKDEIEQIMQSPNCNIESRSHIAREAYKTII